MTDVAMHLCLDSSVSYFRKYNLDYQLLFTLAFKVEIKDNLIIISK